MTRLFSVIGIVLLVLVAGCDRGSYFERMSPEAVSSAKSNFDLLRNHQFEQVEAALDPSLSDPHIDSTLRNMAALIPNQNPESVAAKWVHASCSAHTCDTTVLLEYKYPGERLAVNEVIRLEEGDSSVMGFHIQPIPESVMEANRFTLSGKGTSQYTILALAIFLPLYSLYALVLCLRTKGLRRKWLWAIFILIGLGRVSVLWTTGLLWFYFFSIQLLSSSAIAQPYCPWVVSVSLPLGAILFMFYRKRFKRLNSSLPAGSQLAQTADSGDPKVENAAG
jgi:hypothetical protein